MKKPAKATIEVRGVAVSIVTERAEDYICLTDIARYKDTYSTDDLIRNWLRNRNTIEFLGIWEQLHNPGFNPVEFDGIRMQAGLTASHSLRSSGLSAPAPSASSRAQGAMAAPTRTRTSPSSSPRGFPSSSSSDYSGKPFFIYLPLNP